MNNHPNSDDHYNLNHLTRGRTYRATTVAGIAVGEYLGMESAHGDRAILLRHRTGTASISVCDLTSVRLAA